jgi:hypothetical protein
MFPVSRLAPQSGLRRMLRPPAFPQRVGGRTSWDMPATAPPIHAPWSMSHVDPNSGKWIPSGDTPRTCPTLLLRLLGWVIASHSPIIGTQLHIRHPQHGYARKTPTTRTRVAGVSCVPRASPRPHFSQRASPPVPAEPIPGTRTEQNRYPLRMCPAGLITKLSLLATQSRGAKTVYHLLGASYYACFGYRRGGIPRIPPLRDAPGQGR